MHKCREVSVDRIRVGDHIGNGELSQKLTEVTKVLWSRRKSYVVINDKMVYSVGGRVYLAV